MSNPSTEDLEEAIAKALIGVAQTFDVGNTDVTIQVGEQESRIELNRKGEADMSHSCTTKNIQEKIKESYDKVRTQELEEAIKQSSTPAGTALLERTGVK